MSGDFKNSVNIRHKTICEACFQWKTSTRHFLGRSRTRLLIKKWKSTIFVSEWFEWSFQGVKIHLPNDSRDDFSLVKNVVKTFFFGALSSCNRHKWNKFVRYLHWLYGLRKNKYFVNHFETIREVILVIAIETKRKKSRLHIYFSQDD